MKLRHFCGPTVLAAAILISNPSEANIWQDFSSPLTTSAKPYVLSGTALTLGILLTHYDGEDKFQESTARHKPLGDASKYGDAMGQLIPNAVYCAGQWTASRMGNAAGWQRTQLMFWSTLYAAAVTNALKYTIREPRPNGGDDLSFPSGHATTAFAFAAVVGAEHGVWYGIPAYMLAAFVGYSRINDNVHRLHDVTAGATIGIGYGLGLAALHGSKANSQEAWHVLPIFRADVPGLTVARSF
jgi:membrane-associated phospholipid phosphatase